MLYHHQNHQTQQLWLCLYGVFLKFCLKDDSPHLSKKTEISDTLSTDAAHKRLNDDFREKFPQHIILDDFSTDAVREFIEDGFSKRFIQHNNLTDPLCFFLHSQHPDVVKNIHFIVANADYGRYLWNGYIPRSILNTIAQRYSGNSILPFAEMSDQSIHVEQTFACNSIGESRPIELNIRHDSQYCESYPAYFEAEKARFGTEYVSVLSLYEASDINLFVAYPTFSQSVITPILTRNKAQLQDIFLKSLHASGGMKWFSEHIFSKEGVIAPSASLLLPNEVEKAKYGNKAQIHTILKDSSEKTKKPSDAPATPTIKNDGDGLSDTYSEQNKQGTKLRGVREEFPKYDLSASLHLEADIPSSEDTPLLNTYFSRPVPEDFTERSDKSCVEDDLLNRIQERLSRKGIDAPLLQSEILPEIRHAIREWFQEFQMKIVQDLCEAIIQNLSNIQVKTFRRIIETVQSTIKKSFSGADLPEEEVLPVEETEPKLTAFDCKALKQWPEGRIRDENTGRLENSLAYINRTYDSNRYGVLRLGDLLNINLKLFKALTMLRSRKKSKGFQFPGYISEKGDEVIQALETRVPNFREINSKEAARIGASLRRKAIKREVKGTSA